MKHDYTEKEILYAWNHRSYISPAKTETNLRAFLDALPECSQAKPVPWPGQQEAIDKAFCYLNGDSYIALNRQSAARPAIEATPPAEPEPAAQVPLGPEDCPPGSVFRNAEVCWYNVKYVLDNCVCIDINGRNTLYYQDLKTERWQINTSFPDTGRWDKDAWRPCSKPAGKEVAK